MQLIKQTKYQMPSSKVNTPSWTSSSLTLLLQPPRMPQFSLLLLLIATVPTVASTTASASADNITFSNCSQTFNCGTIRNITYPFTGADRPSHCGPPEFRLSCVDDSTYLSSTTSSLTYKVLQLNQTQRSLTIARTDLYNNTCIQSNYLNTTLNTTIFSYDASNEHLTIFYGCSTLLSLKPENMFACNINGSESSAYYLLGVTPSDPILNVSKCNVSVSVQILRSAADILISNRSLLREALMEGFEVNYTNIYDVQCGKCISKGGRCGFDSVLNEPICICGDEICSITGSTPRKWLIISTVCAAAVLFGIIATVLTIWFHKHHKSSVYEDDNNNVEVVINSHGFLSPRRYKYSELKKITNSFTEKIGHGGYGTVYKGKLLDGRLVAVKLLIKSKGHGEEFINEVASISRTSHVNVVNLLGFCYEGNRKALIYEFMPNGSLDKFIPPEGALHTSLKIDWKILHQIVVGIARGLEYLHRGCTTRILHFDIKPQNILLDEDLIPKISDFGLAKLCLGKESIVSLLDTRGTIGYIAPEVFSRNFGRVSHKSDVYSYGMLVLAMVCGKSINNDQVSHSSDLYFPHSIYKQLQPNRDFKFTGIVTDEEEEIARKLILVSFWCIQTNPTDRPSITKVIDMLEGSLHLVDMPLEPFLSNPMSVHQSLAIATPSNSSNEEEESSLVVDKI